MGLILGGRVTFLLRRSTVDVPTPFVFEGVSLAEWCSVSLTSDGGQAGGRGAEGLLAVGAEEQDSVGLGYKPSINKSINKIIVCEVVFFHLLSGALRCWPVTGVKLAAEGLKDSLSVLRNKTVRDWAISLP